MIKLFSSIFLALCVCSGTFTAHAIEKDSVHEFLSQQGFNPSYDQDGDIRFKFEGKNYFIIFDSKDKDYIIIRYGSRFEDSAAFSDRQAEDLASGVSEKWKGLKCRYTQRSKEGDLTFVFSYELFTTMDNFTRFFERQVSILKSASNEAYDDLQKNR